MRRFLLSGFSLIAVIAAAGAIVFVSVDGASVKTASADTDCALDVDVWELELVEVTADGVTVEDLEEFDPIEFRLVESGTDPLILEAQYGERGKVEEISFSGNYHENNRSFPSEIAEYEEIAWGEEGLR